MASPRDKSAEGLQGAVDAFLSRSGLSAQTRRSYRLTLAALTTALDAAGAEPTATAIEAAARLRWGMVAPATWNRHAATVRSFLGYAARHGLLPELRVELDRRREPADRTRALPSAALERLFARRDIALREKTLWRLLYETAARANEALALDIEDLDLPNRRAAIRGKNGVGAPKAASASLRAARTPRDRSSPLLTADTSASGHRRASFKPGRGTATGLLLITNTSSNSGQSRAHAILCSPSQDQYRSQSTRGTAASLPIRRTHSSTYSSSGRSLHVQQ